MRIETFEGLGSMDRNPKGNGAAKRAARRWGARDGRGGGPVVIEGEALRSVDWNGVNCRVGQPDVAPVADEDQTPWLTAAWLTRLRAGWFAAGAGVGLGLGLWVGSLWG